MATPSMLIVPDRYKSGVLYSQLPESGAVDFDVTRATTAYRTNASGILESVASGVPRLDYPAAGGCPSLLVEPAATNLALRSQEFDNAYWTDSGATITANTAVAPDGTTSMDRITETATSNPHQVISTSITIFGGVARTFSVFVKKGNVRYIQLANVAFGDSSASAIFDLDTKAVTASRASSGAGPTFGFVSATVQDYGNGILRLVLVNTSSFDAPTYRIGHSNQATFAGATLVDGMVSYAGDASSFTDIWGAQLETGSVATSYIPTVAATATRNADVISKTGVSGFIGQTAGTIYAEVQVSEFTADRRIVAISDGTSDNSIVLQKGANSTLRGIVTTASGSVADIATASGQTAGVYKIALAYAANDFVLYVNGTQIGTDTSGAVPACTDVYLGKIETSASTNMLNDRIRAAAIYATRLSNTELASLTSL